MSLPRIRVAFNGLGEIGSHVLREISKHSDIEIVGIQVTSLDEKKDLKHRLYQLGNNPYYGPWHVPVSLCEEGLCIGKNSIPLFTSKEFQSRWYDLGVDVLIECSGKFRKESFHNLRVASYGAKKTIMTYPAAGADAHFVFGINHHSYTSEQNIISAASCTTNCAVPILHALSGTLQIKNGFIITVHALTNSQNPHDSSLIREYSTGASKMIDVLLPALAGKIQCSAVRVPTPEVSYLHLVLNCDSPPTSQEVCAYLKEASRGDLKNILEMKDIGLKNEDVNFFYLGNPHSAVVNGAKIRCSAHGMVDLYAWYDNEYAYSCRVVDLLRYIAEREGWMKKTEDDV